MRHLVKYPILVLMLSVVVWGCKKSTPRHLQTAATLEGFWELRETSAAFNPNTTKYPPGNGSIYHFKGDTLTIFHPRIAPGTYKFSVVPDTTVESSVSLLIPKGQFANRLDYDTTANAPKVFFQITGNKLTFISGNYAVDAGHSSVYERVNGLPVD